MPTSWMDILNQVKSGAISAEEGAEQMRLLEEQAASTGQGAETPGDSPPPRQAEPPENDEALYSSLEDSIDRWRRWWMYPFWAGSAVFLLSASWMAVSFTNERFFWFACAMLPLLFGLTVLVLAAWSRTARWLHVRINEPGKGSKRPSRIALSFPVPIRLAGWGLRAFGPRIPQLNEKMDMVGPVLESLEKSRDPLSVEVNEKDGEKVQVYII